MSAISWQLTGPRVLPPDELGDRLQLGRVVARDGSNGLLEPHAVAERHVEAMQPEEWILMLDHRVPHLLLARLAGADVQDGRQLEHALAQRGEVGPGGDVAREDVLRGGERGVRSEVRRLRQREQRLLLLLLLREEAIARVRVLIRAPLRSAQGLAK